MHSAIHGRDPPPTPIHTRRRRREKLRSQIHLVWLNQSPSSIVNRNETQEEEEEEQEEN